MTEVVRGASAEQVKRVLAGCALVVADETVIKLYPDIARGAYAVPSGEACKTPDVLFGILAEMSRKGVKRCDTVAALGGGATGDVTGLAAALYMRGIAWIDVPTTMLAMVDSSIGGKTAIDFCGIKNLVGAFHEPERTVMCYDFLNTLRDRDKLCGIGEAVKTCLLTKDAYSELIKNIDLLTKRDERTMRLFIELCSDVKQRVVAADARESGLRRILNAGHTVGHALESADEFKLGHGEYVLKGIMTECEMLRDYANDTFIDEVESICRAFTSPPKTSAKAVTERALKDKKNGKESITVMLPLSAGEVCEVELTAREFSARYDRAVKSLKNK